MIMYVNLPVCIPETVFNTVLKEFISGKFDSFYTQWLAAGATLDHLHGLIKVSPNLLGDSQGIDKFNRPLPKHISKLTHQVVLNKMLLNDYLPTLDHWVSAGRTIDYYNNIIKDQNFPQSKPTVPTVPVEPVVEIPSQVSDKKITFLLWKPVSEGGGAGHQGNPVILSKGSDDIGFVVNGKRGTKKGPNNGYSSCDTTTIPASKLPKDTVLGFYDRSSGLPVLFKGKSSYIIGDPTKRYEIKG